MSMKLVTVAALAAGALAQSLTEVLSNTPDLANLTTYVQLFPDLVSQLGSATNITILAPNNDAFAKLLETPAGQALAEDTSLIPPILTYHVLTGTYLAANVTEMPAFIPTLLTNTSYTNVTGGQVVEAVAMDGNVLIFSGLLANATVTQADVTFDGGVVHIIDTVLTVPVSISETAVEAGLSSAAGALTQANLVETVDNLEDVTIFVPNNAAFQAIGSAIPDLTTEQLTDILTYHVISGTVGYSSMLSNTSLATVQGGEVTISLVDDQVFVNSAKVVTPNVLVANGVVHVIDNVLNPSNTTATPDPSAPTQSPAFPDVSSVDEPPLTSGVPTPTGEGGTMPTESTSAPPEATTNAAPPMITAGAMGMAALFAGAAGAVNYL